MSRPAPTQKQSFLQTALLMVALFFGMQLLLNSQRGPQVSEFNGKKLATISDGLTALRDANTKILDVTVAQQLYPAYHNLVNEALQKKQITQAQADAADIEAKVLVGDTQLRAGLLKNDSNRVRAAYQTVMADERKYVGKPEWSVPISTADGTVSGHELHQKIVTELSARNKTDLIWGFIPGGYQFIDFLVNLTGKNPAFSYAFAGFLLALCVRAIVFPLSQRQLMFSRQMSQLTPRVAEIKTKYKDDQVEQNKRVMELYAEYGINPFMGCWPAFVQIPLFWTVYQCMLHYQFEFQHGHFLWINPVTSAATNGFVAADLGKTDYILIVLYGISMVISTLLTPVTDPTQLKQQRMLGIGMSVAFTVAMMFGLFPVVSGFVLYWTFTNVLATAQSLRAYRLPLPPLVKVNAPGGGVYPKAGLSGKWMQMFEEAQKTAEEQRKASSNGSDKGKDKPDSDGGSVKAIPGTNGKPKTPPAASNGSAKKNPPSPKNKPKKRA